MTDDSMAIVPAARAEIVRASGVDERLSQIRPYWQTKPLIERVKRLIAVDPSSACQRLFNAAVQDLKMKIVHAGVDLAREAAIAHSLPPVQRAEDVTESYSTMNVINLSYRMGLLERPEWKRLLRAYDIRGDLEHEDDEYEASIEDLTYVFGTCIEIVLSKDPVELLRVSDVKELVQSSGPVSLSVDFLDDYRRAPQPRQLEILRFLVSTALAGQNPDLVRQNAVEALRALRASTADQVKIDLVAQIQEGAPRRGPLDLARMKIAAASGALPYVRQAQVQATFNDYADRLYATGYGWRNWSSHGALLDELEDIGGLANCSAPVRPRVILWMVLCYLGEPGKYGHYGRNREVFYSNSAAPRIERLVRAAGPSVRPDIEQAMEEPRIKAAVKVAAIARRLDALLDLTEVAPTLT